MSTTSFSNDSREAKAFADTGAYKVGTLFVKTLGFAILAFIVIFAYRGFHDFPVFALIEGTPLEVFLLGIALGYVLALMQTAFVRLVKALYYRINLLRISLSQPVTEWLDNAGSEIEGLPLNDVMEKIQSDIRLRTFTVGDLWKSIQLHPRWETRVLGESGYVGIFPASPNDDESMSLNPACSRFGMWFIKGIGLFVILYLLLYIYPLLFGLPDQSLLIGAAAEVLWGGLVLGAIVPPIVNFANNLSKAIYHALRAHWPTS